MTRDLAEVLSLQDLADQTGTPARTIRFYITRGLLPAPLRSGRGAVYGEQHLSLLQQIKNLQSTGMTLQEVALSLGPQTVEGAVPAHRVWLEYQVADDVFVRAAADVSPWRQRHVRRLVTEFAAKLSGIPLDQEEQEEE